MPKTKISEFSSTPANNTDIDSINIAEGCAPSGINDAIRELMAQLKDWQSGTSNDPMVIGSSGSLTLNQGTANGVTYLNGSKVVTSGSALTFDGTDLRIGTSSGSFYQGSGLLIQRSGYSTVRFNDTAGTSAEIKYADSLGLVLESVSNRPVVFSVNASEQMRLTSTGLGIGTSSPAYKLDVRTGSGNAYANVGRASKSAGQVALQLSGGTSGTDWIIYQPANSDNLTFFGNSADRMVLSSSGNLGLGVTPSAWDTVVPAFQIGGAGGYIAAQGSNEVLRIGSNNYYSSSAFRYVINGSASRYDQSAGAHAWFTAPSGTAGNAISFTQAMTLDASGNLGVGTTSPASRLNVSTGEVTLVTYTSTRGSGSYNTYAMGTSGTILGYIGHAPQLVTGTSDNQFAVRAETALVFASGGAVERARIDSSGNLCVGATSKVYDGKISVGFSSTGSQGIALIDNTATTGGIYAYFINSSGNVAGSITHNGTTTVAYNTSSDYRLKDITGPITTSGAYIDSLKPVEGTWKSDGSVFVGLLAHEAQEASRTAVATGTKDGAEMQAMDYSSPEIIANLIAEIKSLRVRVAQLESN